MLILLTVSWLLYARTLKKDFQNEIISNLEEISMQGKSLLTREIDGKLEMLTEISRRVSFYGVDEYEKAAAMLKATAIENGFKRMGIITADGRTYTTDHAQIDLSDRSYYKAGLNGEMGISDPLVTGRGLEKSMVIFGARLP